MEGRWQLDLAGYSTRGRVIRSLAVVLVLILSSLPSVSQAALQAFPITPALRAKVGQLFAASRWPEIVHEIEPLPAPDADLFYYYGDALAHLERWDEAQRALLAGHRLAPQDERFPVELAGVAFKQKRYREASLWLRRALRINPADPYANDFLGTVYFLQGNLDAALKYWNRSDKPQIESVRPDHPLEIRPALLDRALAFSPAGPLLLPDLRTSQARLEGLGVFHVPSFQLAARGDGKFDVVLNLQERNGWGDSKWQALVSTFRGVGYETIYPEYFNLGGSAINIQSLVRWDAQKRRLGADISGPLHQNPKWHYRLGTDLRNENWAIRDSFTGTAPVLGALNLRREEAHVEITSFNSGRWTWSAGVELSHRDYRNVDQGSALTSQLLLQGTQLKQTAGIQYELWRVPEHRFVVSSSASSQLARIWSRPSEAFGKLQGSLVARWFPKTEGDDYATQLQVRGGGTAGTAPFDELYMLGFERDNDLWLRAHIGTRDGIKGSAPLGRTYFLTNTEVDKNLYGNGLLSLKLSPFLDTGKITDPSGSLGSQKWLWDTGLQAKLRILGVGLTCTFGKDLRTGNNAFYVTAVAR
jgi:tetratricopeptide (TPR) repeat protein